MASARGSERICCRSCSAACSSDAARVGEVEEEGDCRVSRRMIKSSFATPQLASVALSEERVLPE